MQGIGYILIYKENNKKHNSVILFNSLKEFNNFVIEKKCYKAGEYFEEIYHGEFKELDIRLEKY